MIRQDLPVDDALMAGAPQDMQARWEKLKAERAEFGKERKRQLVPDSQKVTKEDRQRLALKSLQARKKAKAHSASYDTVGNTGLLSSLPQHFSPHAAQYPPTTPIQSMLPFHVQGPEISELDRARVEFKDALEGEDSQRADDILKALKSHDRSSLLNEELDRELWWNITDNYFDFEKLSRVSYLLDKGANPQTLEARWSTISFLIHGLSMKEPNADEDSIYVREALYHSLDKLISFAEIDPNIRLYGGIALAQFVEIFCHCTVLDYVNGSDSPFRRGGWPEFIMTRLLDKGSDPGPDVRLSKEAQISEEKMQPMMCRRFRAIYEDWRNKSMARID